MTTKKRTRKAKPAPVPAPAKETRRHRVQKTRSDDSQRSKPAPGRPNVNNAARIIGVFGATGSGKSHAIKGTLAAAPAGVAAVVFDPGHEYETGAVFESGAEVEFLRACVPGARLVFRPSFDGDLRERQFDRFCSAALALCRASGRCIVVAEELQRMTRPGWAPRYWSELVTTGRKWGATVIAASQRPAMVDKDFWSNVSRLQCRRLNFADDQATLARALNVPLADVQTLSGYQYLDRDMTAGAPAVRGE